MLVLMFTCAHWLVQFFKRNPDPEVHTLRNHLFKFPDLYLLKGEPLLMIGRPSEQRWVCFNWIRQFFKRNKVFTLSKHLFFEY